MALAWNRHVHKLVLGAACLHSCLPKLACEALAPYCTPKPPPTASAKAKLTMMKSMHCILATYPCHNNT
eukprot:scaffold804_cov85-Skeletonema_dohrnii-CCMP3373.AAC.10